MKQTRVPFSSLLSQIADPSSQVRLHAIKAIMRRSTERGQALGNLLALLNDPDEHVCKATLTALERLGDPQAIPQLAHLPRSHPRARVRLQAFDVLVRIDAS